ncbi:EF-hand_domain [Hexamita inflata]|uniref:EF-hand_domain n=1 Tax=Hexamita inflata TaxID=28002 RepID=A0ABP1HHL3_9EUKA
MIQTIKLSKNLRKSEVIQQFANDLMVCQQPMVIQRIQPIDYEIVKTTSYYICMGCGGMYAEKEFIEPIEIHWELRKHFQNMPQSASMVIVRLMDRNNDGNVNKTEFSAFMSVMDEISTENDVYKLIFRAMDANNSNSIDTKELSVFFETLKINVNPRMFGENLNQEEFKKVIGPYLSAFVGDDVLPFAETA